MTDYPYRKTTRLQEWDYGSNGYYFITICTKDKEPYFGEVINGVMHLSDVGTMAHDYWYKIPKHFEYVELDVFVVMPNHIHGIIIMNKSDCRDKALPCPKGTVSSIIGSYKSIVTKRAREVSAFAWQSRFYDHIIRNDISLMQIQRYVESNPQKWEEDRFYCQ